VCCTHRNGRSLIYHNDSVDSFHDVRLQERWLFEPTRRRKNGTRSGPTETVGRNTALFQSTKLFYVTGGIRNFEKNCTFYRLQFVSCNREEKTEPESFSETLVTANMVDSKRF
jgi:hypothetical protein